MSDAVVLITASFGPGSGIALSITPTLPIARNASPFISHLNPSVVREHPRCQGSLADPLPRCNLLTRAAPALALLTQCANSLAPPRSAPPRAARRRPQRAHALAAVCPPRASVCAPPRAARSRAPPAPRCYIALHYRHESERPRHRQHLPHRARLRRHLRLRPQRRDRRRQASPRPLRRAGAVLRRRDRRRHPPQRPHRRSPARRHRDLALPRRLHLGGPHHVPLVSGHQPDAKPGPESSTRSASRCSQ